MPGLFWTIQYYSGLFQNVSLFQNRCLSDPANLDVTPILLHHHSSILHHHCPWLQLDLCHHSSHTFSFSPFSSSLSVALLAGLCSLPREGGEHSRRNIWGGYWWEMDFRRRCPMKHLFSRDESPMTRLVLDNVWHTYKADQRANLKRQGRAQNWQWLDRFVN